MKDSIVVKMLDLMRRRRRCEEVEHEKLATPVAIPTSAAAFKAIPAQLHRPPLSVPQPTSRLAFDCDLISRYARHRKPPCLIRLVPKSVSGLKPLARISRSETCYSIKTSFCHRLHTSALITQHGFISPQSQIAPFDFCITAARDVVQSVAKVYGTTNIQGKNQNHRRRVEHPKSS